MVWSRSSLMMFVLTVSVQILVVWGEVTTTYDLGWTTSVRSDNYADVSNDTGLEVGTVINGGVSFSTEFTSVLTYMDKSTTVYINYTVDCSFHPRENYRFVPSLTDSNVITITKMKTLLTQEVVVACDDGKDSSSKRVYGTFVLTLHGMLPGRSVLTIDAVPENDTNQNPLPLVSVGNTPTRRNISTSRFGELSGSVQYSQLEGPLTREVTVNSSLPVYESFPAKFNVICMKEQTTLDTVFRVLMVVFLICLTVAMGCKTELHVLREVWHRPVAPIIGLCCQFFLMPLIAFGLTMAVDFPSETMALGFFACGCAPGGGASNFYTYLLKGDVSLSVAMTTISNIAAIGTFPLWIFTLGRLVLTDQSEVKIPYVNIIISLLMIVLPLTLGTVLNYKRPKFTKSLVKLLIPLTVIQLLLISAMGFYLNIYMFRLITPSLLAVTFFLPNLGFIVGLFCARLFKQTWKFSRTIAIETGVQNIGIAFILVMFSFSPPDNILAGIAPVTSSMMTSIPLLLVAASYHLYLRFYVNRPRASTHPHRVLYKQHDDSVDVFSTLSKQQEIGQDVI